MSFWYARFGWQAFVLAPLSIAYGLLVRVWHGAFAVGLRKSVRVEGAWVISVGNLVAGGSGKTPVVIHLASEGVRRGHRVAVLSRGHGRTSTKPLSFTASTLPKVSDAGDEPRLIARRCPQVTVYVGADRVASARAAVAAGANVLILDDGFQHRQLARDVDLLVDGGEGNGWLMPAGPLREPSSHRARATHLWGRDGQPGDLTATHELVGVRDPLGVVHPASSLSGRKVVLLLGIARPERVHDSVQTLGAHVIATHAFADHHVFTEAELEAARRSAAAAEAIVLTTEKDAERLTSAEWTLVMDVRVTSVKRDVWLRT